MHYRGGEGRVRVNSPSDPKEADQLKDKEEVCEGGWGNGKLGSPWETWREHPNNGTQDGEARKAVESQTQRRGARRGALEADVGPREMRAQPRIGVPMPGRSQDRPQAHRTLQNEGWHGGEGRGRTPVPDFFGQQRWLAARREADKKGPERWGSSGRCWKKASCVRTMAWYPI